MLIRFARNERIAALFRKHCFLKLDGDGEISITSFKKTTSSTKFDVTDRLPCHEHFNNIFSNLKRTQTSCNSADISCKKRVCSNAKTNFLNSLSTPSILLLDLRFDHKPSKKSDNVFYTAKTSTRKSSAEDN